MSTRKTPTNLQGQFLQFLARRPRGQFVPRGQGIVNEKTVDAVLLHGWATTDVPREDRQEYGRHFKITEAGLAALANW